jgi:Family of unknown function (DUF5522)
MSNIIEGEDFYYNEEGFMVLTSSYHLKREACCGRGCLHCPYDYKNVEPSRRVTLLKERPPVIIMQTTKK